MDKRVWGVLIIIILGAILYFYSSLYLAPAPEISQCDDELPGSEWIEPYKDFLKSNENDQRKGRGDDGLWRPIGSPEGGFEICYGHKLQPGEPPIRLRDGRLLNPPLTDEECDLLLEDDIWKHIDRVLDDNSCVKKDLREKYGGRCLSAEEIMIFLDYEYTGVLCKFPKFRRGVLEPDWGLACQEYKRFFTTPDGRRLPLERRNIEFCCNFLEEHGCNCGTNKDGTSVCNSGNNYGFP